MSVGGPPDRVSVVPGNHDIYSDIGRDPGIARWAPYMAGAAMDDAFPFVRRFGRIALIGVNSAVVTPPLVASGRVGQPQMQRLARVLGDLRRADVVCVVMIHHPPLPGQNRPSKALLDADAFALVLTECGADLVIHGHNHRTMRVDHPTLAGAVTSVIGVASASLAVPHPADDLARYHVFRFEDDGRITQDTRGLTGPSGDVATLATTQVRPAR
jgi:3',5'-cyclic AMP phosphodiesterase CpdA